MTLMRLESAVICASVKQVPSFSLNAGSSTTFENRNEINEMHEASSCYVNPGRRVGNHPIWRREKKLLE
jgi:hypothetical protein